jgi:hypothetical protein
MKKPTVKCATCHADVATPFCPYCGTMVYVDAASSLLRYLRSSQKGIITHITKMETELAAKPSPERLYSSSRRLASLQKKLAKWTSWVEWVESASKPVTSKKP